jgi:hypothetical protein
MLHSENGNVNIFLYEDSYWSIILWANDQVKYTNYYNNNYNQVNQVTNRISWTIPILLFNYCLNNWGGWPCGQCAPRAIAGVKQLWSVIRIRLKLLRALEVKPVPVGTQQSPLGSRGDDDDDFWWTTFRLSLSFRWSMLIYFKQSLLS